MKSLHCNGACHGWWLLHLLESPGNFGVLDNLRLLCSHEVGVVLICVSFTDLFAIETSFGQVILKVLSAVEVLLLVVCLIKRA